MADLDSIKKHLTRNDVVLKDIIHTIPYPYIKSTENVFHDLMSCIIEQQIHYRSSKKTFQKMLQAASIEYLTIDNFAELERKGFEGIKLSAKKYETIVAVLDFFEQHSIDFQSKGNEEVREILSGIKGVGAWTIDMILMYTLERPNVFSPDDYHIKQMMLKLYDIDETARIKAQQKAIAEQWSPYQSIAMKYLLAWKTFQKKGIN